MRLRQSQSFLEIQVVLYSRSVRPHFSHGTRGEDLAIDIRIDSGCVRMNASVIHIRLSVVPITQTHGCISLAVALSPSWTTPESGRACLSAPSAVSPSGT